MPVQFMVTFNTQPLCVYLSSVIINIPYSTKYWLYKHLVDYCKKHLAEKILVDWLLCTATQLAVAIG